jgi:hypothetical protein
MFLDHLDNPGESSPWDVWFGYCKTFVDRVNAAGGNATMLHPPELGIHGNSHMWMLDKNNLQLADLIMNWIDTNVGKNKVEEPEAPWAVDQAIKSRTGNGAPAGLGTITPDNAQVLENASYLALEAYKFDLPNAELFLPGSTCPSCNPTALNATNTWTPKALAELVVGLGGAIVATHSQSGQIGMNMVRVLREQGKLNMLKGLMQVEGGSNTAASGTTPADFVNNNIPYLQFKGDYSATSAVSTQLVAAIKALGGKADYIELDQPGWWQGSYAGPFGAGYVGPFAGVSHMMMIEDNPSPAGKATNLQVMDVLLKWADMNISKPETQSCDEKGVPPGLSKKPGGLPPGQAK